MTMNPGRTALRSFYLNVKAADPTLAVLISDAVIQIALFEDDEDKSPVQDAIVHLRQRMTRQPPELRLMMERALEKLGY